MYLEGYSGIGGLSVKVMKSYQEHIEYISAYFAWHNRQIGELHCPVDAPRDKVGIVPRDSALVKKFATEWLGVAREERERSIHEADNLEENINRISRFLSAHPLQ